MKYNLQNKNELNEAKQYFDDLIDKKVIVEIKRCFNRRTYSQNNYLHLLLSMCALEIGETLDFFKSVIWKQHIAKDIFKDSYTNPKTGEKREDWKSSADIDTKEMTIAIDRLMKWAAEELQLKLPLPTDIYELRKIENYVESNKYYL